MIFPLVHLLVICYLIIYSHQTHNNVCKTFNAYQTIVNNPDCWYDPDVKANAVIEQIAYNNGYKCEPHQVITEDGYILTVFRIASEKSKPPVLLLHGIFLDGRAFMLLKNESLAFSLSDQGYDVWLANARGSKYSSKHVNYTISDQRFWDFSFHEMGYYDIPAIIDYIRMQSAHKVAIIGHSMGTTASFVYASIRPQHANNNLRRIISLAPTVYLTHSSVALNYNLLYSILLPFASYGIGRNKPFLMNFLEDSCSTYPILASCTFLILYISGYNPMEIRPEVLPKRLGLGISGVSVKTILHFVQLTKAMDNFQNYDYGEIENIKRYNSKAPQKYDLAKISVPVDLFYGKLDRLAVEKDVLRLYNNLSTRKSITAVFDEGAYDHEAFIMGKTAAKLYSLIVQILEEPSV